MTEKKDDFDKKNALVDQVAEAALDAIEAAETAEERFKGTQDLQKFFGEDEAESFVKLNADEQEAVVNAYVERAKSGDALGSVEKILEGLHLKPPEATPATPTPAFSNAPAAPAARGPSPSGPGGMGGGKIVRFPPVKKSSQETDDNGESQE